MDRLPSNLLYEILFKLNTNSLAMMQCTNRCTRSHISDDPYFMSQYLSHVGSGLFHTSTFGFKFLFWHVISNPWSTRNTYPLEVAARVLGSCSGLLLLFIDGICVTNPHTKMFQFLGHFESRILTWMVRGGKWDQRNRIGFAVDRIDRTTQRFKLVCLIEIKTSNPQETMYHFEIHKGDSSWRLSETTLTCPTRNLMPSIKPLYLENGALYWLRNDGSIVAFDPEIEQTRLIPIKFPQKPSSKILLAAADNELALIWPTKEVIYVYTLKKILTDPKWVLVKRIGNAVVDKARYWNVVAYDGKGLILTEDRVIHWYDLRANEWEVMSSIPRMCDSNWDFYLFKPSLSSSINLNEKVDAVTMAYVENHISSLREIIRLINGMSPYAQNLLKKKESKKIVD